MTFGRSRNVKSAKTRLHRLFTFAAQQQFLATPPLRINLKRRLALLKFNSKIADQILPYLTGGGDEQRASIAVTAYRHHQTPKTEEAAIDALAALGEPMQIEIRQAA